MTNEGVSVNSANPGVLGQTISGIISDTQKVVTYTDQSGIYGKSLSIKAVDRKDYIFDLKVSVQGLNFMIISPRVPNKRCFLAKALN